MDVSGQGNRMHRKSLDLPWNAHCLTFSCFQRQAFFPGRFAASWYLEALGAARASAPFDLWAWVIMPEHLHIVLLPHEGVAMRQVLWHLKKPFSDCVVKFV